MNNEIVYLDEKEYKYKFSGNLQDIVNQTQKRISSSKESAKVKHVFRNIMNDCLKSDFENTSSVKNVSKRINEFININFEEREFMDNIIIKTFSTKEDIKEIYKYEGNEKEYWLIVDDVYSKTSMEYYDLYYDLLENADIYFDVKILNVDDLKGLDYMNPKKIYGKDRI